MPEQNIEFDPRLIRPHAAISTEPITEKDSQLYWQFIVFRNEFYRKYFLPRERSTWLKKNEESRFKSHWVSTSAKFRTTEQNIAFDPRLMRGTNN